MKNWFRFRNPLSKLTLIQKYFNKKKNSSFMNLMLNYNDKIIEKLYVDSVIVYQQNYMRFFQISFFLVIFSAWILNPLEIEHFSGAPLIINLINMILNIIAAIYFFYKKNFEYPNYGILFLQIYTIIGYIEYNLDVIKKEYTKTSFVTTTLFLEIVMLVSMISRCSWKINFISSSILNCFLNFRYTNFEDNVLLKGSPSMTHFFNFLFITTCSYFHEKYDRETFFKRYQSEEILKRFEQIIREVLPASIIIFNNEDILFYNNETKKMINSDEKNLIEDRLKLISVSYPEQKDDNYNNIEDINILSEENLALENEKITCTGNNIFGFYSQVVNSKIKSDFLRLIGLIPENEAQIFIEQDSTHNQSKYLDIKLGRISWKGSDAVMAIISKDLATQRLYDLKEQANYKDKLLATVSHDLRTPLNGVIGILDLELEGLLDKSLKENLQFALRSSNLLLFMINDILDFSQISKGSLSLHPINFDIEELIKDTTKLIKFQAKRKGVTLQIENKIKKKSKIMFYSDPNRLKQVILNLLGNALKFTQQGLIKISYEEVVIDNSRSKSISSELMISPLKQELLKVNPIKFSVEDTGCGIKKEDIPKLFQLFGMLKNEENKRINTTGVGLGLAISQQLVKILNKNIEDAIIKVDSEYGKGSIFSFVLYPFQEKPSNNEKYHKNSVGHLRVLDEGIGIDEKYMPKFDIKPNQKVFNRSALMKKVLLVDDDQINILVLTKIFQTFKDCEPTFAFNGKHALDIVKEKAKNNNFFNIVFMDCNMPVMDGFEATTRILEMVKNKEIPELTVVASTANVTQNDRENCFKCGMADFITKPLTKQTLREKLDAYC